MYDLLLILHFIGLALGVGTSFANLALGLASKDMEPAERVKFFLRASALGKNGSIGLVLLLVTGIGMMVMRGTAATFALGGPWFHTKLTRVLILSGLLGYIQVLLKRAKAEQGGPVMAKIPKVGSLMLVTGLLIVVCAVEAFH
jgi:uncharacterized membrane protein